MQQAAVVLVSLSAAVASLFAYPHCWRYLAQCRMLRFAERLAAAGTSAGEVKELLEATSIRGTPTGPQAPAPPVTLDVIHLDPEIRTSSDQLPRDGG